MTRVGFNTTAKAEQPEQPQSSQEQPRWRQRAREIARKAHKYLDKAQDVAHLAAQLQGRPGPLALLGLAVSGAKMASDVLREGPGKVWQVVDFPAELGAQVRELLKPRLKWEPDIDGDPIFEDVEGQRVMISRDVRPIIWASNDREQARAYLIDLLRAECGGHFTVVPRGDALAVERVDAPAGEFSAEADRLWQRVGPPALAGHCRALLLDGPPGTGKSTIARNLAARMCDALPGASSLRIAVSDLPAIRPEALSVLVEALQPAVVLIDDLDRFEGAGSLLDAFEAFHRPGGPRLVLTTTNEAYGLPEALRRPGRIDEVATVEGVGRDLALTILGDQAGKLTPEHLDAAAGWPAAHVAELALRLRTIPGVDVDAEVASVGGRAR